MERFTRFKFILFAAAALYTLPAFSTDVLEQEEGEEVKVPPPCCCNAADWRLLEKEKNLTSRPSSINLCEEEDKKMCPQSRKGYILGNIMCFVAPVLKYGTTACILVGFVSIALAVPAATPAAVVVTGSAIIAIPLAIAFPPVTALGVKISQAAVRAVGLCLGEEAQKAYKQAIEKRGYTNLAPLPFEDEMCKAGRWVIHGCKSVLNWFLPSSPRKIKS